MISVLILTRNEARDLPGCLESVAWCDDVHVHDSYSTDTTADIALAHGAQVHRRPGQDLSRYFGGDESEHRNWSLREVPFKYPWVLLIDADERVSPGLRESAAAAVAAPGPHVAFRIQRRDFFLGTWLKHVQTSPFYLRLLRPERVRYERLINPVTIADGPVGSIGGFLDHYPFSKGITHWIDRHNSYSTLEARQIAENRKARSRFSLRSAFLERDFNERRYHQKELFYRLPFRPLVKFLILYLGKRGFLDGRAGFTYATLQSIYEYFIVLKTRELEQPEPAGTASSGRSGPPRAD